MSRLVPPPNHLNEETQEQFTESGYVFTPGLLPAETVSELQNEANELLELLVNASLYHKRNIRVFQTQSRTGKRASLRKVQPYLDLSSTFSSFVTSEEFLKPIGQLYGDDPVLDFRSSKLNYKQPLEHPIEGLAVEEREDEFPIHSDWNYYRRNNYPEGVTTTIVFLDDVEEDSGPLQIWPGTHKEEFEHEVVDIGRQVVPGALDEYDSQTLLGPAGSVLTFDSRMVHSSSPNVSDRPRKFMISTHFPAANETESYNSNYDVHYFNDIARDVGDIVEYQSSVISGNGEQMWRLPESLRTD